MGPAQTQQQQQTGKREVTMAELLALAQQQGVTVTDAPDTQELSMEQKLAALGEHLQGAMGAQEGLSDEQKTEQMERMRSAMQMDILMKEKEVLRKYPEATPDQQWQIAQAMITGDVFGALEHSSKMFSAAAEKEKEAASREVDLNVEGDGGGDSTGKEPAVGVDQLFAPGGTLDASLAARSA